MNIEQLGEYVLSGEYRKSHTSKSSGYISRKSEGVVSEYSGRFGEGYTVRNPCLDSTRYHYVTYYIKQ